MKKPTTRLSLTGYAIVLVFLLVGIIAVVLIREHFGMTGLWSGRLHGAIGGMVSVFVGYMLAQLTGQTTPINRGVGENEPDSR